jgi:hypothetical protein
MFRLRLNLVFASPRQKDQRNFSCGPITRAEMETVIEPLAKLPIDNHCHSERSEESRISKGLRSFTSFRMTEKRLLQEARYSDYLRRKATLYRVAVKKVLIGGTGF